MGLGRFLPLPWAWAFLLGKAWVDCHRLMPRRLALVGLPLPPKVATPW